MNEAATDLSLQMVNRFLERKTEEFVQLVARYSQIETAHERTSRGLLGIARSQHTQHSDTAIQLMEILRLKPRITCEELLDLFELRFPAETLSHLARVEAAGSGHTYSEGRQLFTLSVLLRLAHRSRTADCIALVRRVSELFRGTQWGRELDEELEKSEL